MAEITLVTREGAVVRDAYGRVRVDCGDYEDWMLVEDLPEDLASLIPTMLIPNTPDAPEAAPVAEIGGSPKLTPEPVTQRSGEGVTQQQLAAALAAQLAGDRGNGGGTTRKQQAQASPEAEAANLRRLEALARKAEAEADIARAKAQRAQADADSAPADSAILLRLRQSAEITRLSRNLIADSVAAAEDAHEVTLLTLERQAAQEAIAHRNEIQAEKWRRRRLGTTNWQLFLWGLLGWIVGGLIVGAVAGGDAVGATMAGQAAGALLVVGWRVQRGKAQEWREGEAQRREAYQAQQQAGQE